MAVRGGLQAAARNPVGCQTNAWQFDAGNFAALIERVAILKRLGFEAFECNIRFVQDQFPNPKEARARIRQTGVRFYGTHIGIKFGLEQLESWVKGAASLGAEKFVLSGQNSLLKEDDTLDQAALREKVATLNQLSKSCQAAGLRLVYHNHRPEFQVNASEMEELLRQTDMSVLLDVGHAYLAKADVPAFVARHHQRIDAMHLRDIRGKAQVPMGQGDFDFGALAAVIRKTAWPGWLTLEEESLKSTDDAYVESVLKSGRQLIRKFFNV
jgi:sugar phosphate isomerase/epimerase